MKARKSAVILSVILALVITTVAGAQIQYDKATITSYQVVNLGANKTTIVADYYKSDGTKAFTNTFTDVPAKGVVTVQQALESGLPSGQFSAVLSAGEPLAAIVNQQLGDTGSGTSTAPFSSYGAVSSGSNEVTIPVVMHNWFGYHTEFFIQNVSGTPATVTIDYKPTTLTGCTTGTAVNGSAAGTLPASTAKPVSQRDLNALRAPDATGCSAFKDRFLGAATVKSTGGAIAVIVNQYVQDKLFTYNGFSNTGGTTLIVPAYLRNFYNYYASLTIANPGTGNANVKLTYTPSAVLSNPTAAIEANYTIPAGKSITIYDGPTGSSDLSSAYPYGTTKRFFGTVKIVSENSVPVVAMVNQESTLAGGNEAGAYNASSSTEGTQKISVPLIQSDFYGYYTSLTIATVDGSNATLRITYTSDGTYSSVKNTSKAYEMSTENGVLNRYEGSSASAAQSDILDDAAWESGGTGRFIGSALIEVVGTGANIVAFVNSESNSAPMASTRDSMYSFNAFNLQ